MQTPFFSVIIPVYNKEPHIARSILSVLNQTFQNFELIIVCDPSTDNSNDVVESFEDSKIRVYYRNTPGPGGYAARNLGIEKARADWITFLDADDEWLPDHLESLYHTHLIYPEQAIISCGWQIFQHGKYRNDKYSSSMAHKKHHTIDFYQYLVSETSIGRPIWTSVVCIKKDILNEANLFPEGQISMGGDVDTWLRCVEKAKSLAWSNHIGAIYNTDSVNMVTKNSIITPELHTQTLNYLLSKQYPNQINDLLKIRYNNLLTVAWNQNMHMPIDNNFDISKLIFFRVQPLKASTYLIFSKLPFPLSKPLHSFLYKLIAIKRLIVLKSNK